MYAEISLWDLASVDCLLAQSAALIPQERRHNPAPDLPCAGYTYVRRPDLTQIVSPRIWQTRLNYNSRWQTSRKRVKRSLAPHGPVENRVPRDFAACASEKSR